MTLRQFAHGVVKQIPVATSWYLAELGEARGKQDLFTKQSLQKLKLLREHALIESAISSNRIEGVTIDRKRIGTVVFGRARLRDRDEAEVRGYRDALTLIHSHGGKLPVSEETLLQLHRLAHRGGDAGRYKDRDSDIIERSPDGRVRVRFKTVPARRTPASMQELIDSWNRCLSEQWIHPLIALASMNLDLLCIHPFRDGNGRVSRLLLLLQCYHLGFEAGRYVSLERLIEENKERYYQTLEESSVGWHEGKHDPWPYVHFILFILSSAYREFESRVGELSSPKGAKAELVLRAIREQPADFRLIDIERICPGVSREWIRKLVSELRTKGEIHCRGRGPAARWYRTNKSEKRSKRRKPR